MRTVTLTTDFSLRDGYVAAMKGVMLQLEPRLKIVDVSHEVAPQGLYEAAFVASQALPYFPDDAVHVLVVDPGVGSSRQALVAQSRDGYLVLPDNGLLSLLEASVPVGDIRRIANPQWLRQPVSATFHGRDIFAPVAARLAAGSAFTDVGPLTQGEVLLKWETCEATGASKDGQVIYVDRFGNLISSIRALSASNPEGGLQIGELWLPLRRTYSDGQPGQVLALCGSHGFLEVAVCGGHASKELGLTVGAPVQWRPKA